MRDDILDLPGLVASQSPPGQPGPLNASQAFTTLLTSESSKFYDSDGKYLGRAIRFSLAGGQPWDDGTCAERIWRITPSVQTGSFFPTGPNATRLVLYQQNTFGSQVCTEFTDPDLPHGTTQMVRYQPTSALLTGDDAATFSSATGFSSISIDWFPDKDKQPLQAGQPGDPPFGFAAGFAGRGMIANYILLFPACPSTDNPTCSGEGGWTDSKLTHVTDVLLRFDVVSASNPDNDVPSEGGGGDGGEGPGGPAGG
jgi:hypothetical protein